jgi:hypothetical protein
VASWGPGRLGAFGLGRDGDMFHRTHLSDKGWEAQEDRNSQRGSGGALRSAPSAVSWDLRKWTYSLWGLITRFG